jgi:hypothetical protein
MNMVAIDNPVAAARLNIQKALLGEVSDKLRAVVCVRKMP